MLISHRRQAMQKAVDISSLMADSSFRISCDSSKLPEGAVLEPELQWTDTLRTIAEHMSQFSPEIQAQFSNRNLKLVPAASIGAGIHSMTGFGIHVLPDDHYVVISFPR